jgi:hypothetical protein
MQYRFAHELVPEDMNGVERKVARIAAMAALEGVFARSLCELIQGEQMRGSLIGSFTCAGSNSREYDIPNGSERWSTIGIKK